MSTTEPQTSVEEQRDGLLPHVRWEVLEPLITMEKTPHVVAIRASDNGQRSTLNDALVCVGIPRCNSNFWPESLSGERRNGTRLVYPGFFLITNSGYMMLCGLEFRNWLTTEHPELEILDMPDDYVEERRSVRLQSKIQKDIVKGCWGLKTVASMKLGEVFERYGTDAGLYLRCSGGVIPLSIPPGTRSLPYHYQAALSGFGNPLGLFMFEKLNETETEDAVSPESTTSPSSTGD